MSAGAKRKRFAPRSGSGLNDTLSPRPPRKEVNPAGRQYVPVPPEIGIRAPSVIGNLLTFPPDLGHPGEPT